ncbi:AMP-binding protein, partial [Sorangium cellulosum]|uniref:AMP-binding protein n=1 Tax=Sorangium cellulosum TaxID=56 RepID=UPI0012DB5802
MSTQHTARRDPRSDRFLIDSTLRSFAASRPDHVALVSEGRRITYRELDALADRCAALFREASVHRGDRVMIALDNGVDAVVAYYGALRADGVPSLLGTAMRPRRFGQVMELAEPRVLVAARGMRDTLAAVAELPPGARPA